MDSIPQNFYVYTLINSLTNNVFYVGKGHLYRMGDHERQARRDLRSHKCNLIRKIWRDGGEVIKEKVAEFQWEKDAFIYEWCLINLIYGRENLTNGTDGGEGATGYRHTPESREKLDRHLNSPEFHERQIAGGRTVKNFKSYKGFISPDGIVYSPVQNLTKFCREHNLGLTCMLDLENEKIYQHKGWKKYYDIPPERNPPFSRCGKHSFISQEGIIYQEIPNLNYFCRQHKLDACSMSRLYMGHIQSHHGWTIYPPPQTKISRKTSGHHSFISPEGIIHQNIGNLNAFCKERNLDNSTMVKVSKGIGKHRSHKGWTRYEVL